MLLELLKAPIQTTAGAGLSSDAIAAIIGAVVGGVLGMLAAVIGQYVQRRLRMKGKVHCRVRSFMVNFLGPNVVRFSFPIYLYNDKDVDIGALHLNSILHQNYKVCTKITSGCYAKLRTSSNHSVIGSDKKKIKYANARAASTATTPAHISSLRDPLGRTTTKIPLVADAS